MVLKNNMLTGNEEMGGICTKIDIRDGLFFLNVPDQFFSNRGCKISFRKLRKLKSSNLISLKAFFD